MQDRDRKSAKGKPPISRHPLFPAVVALWFGALFGLGSMAIRPGLIEDMVLAAGIDTLVPAAAPPLGMTARLLVALTMAGLGGLIGGLLARRLARPATEPRTRRRGAVSSPASTERFAQPAFRAADESAPADEELDSMLAPKRRSLAIEAQLTPRELHEHAPLPGGPLILNVSDIDSDDSLAAEPADLWSRAGRETVPAEPAASSAWSAIAEAPDFAPPHDFSAPAPAQALPESSDEPWAPAPEPESTADLALRSESYARIAGMNQAAPSPIAGFESARPLEFDRPETAPPAPSVPPKAEHRRFDAPVQAELAPSEPAQSEVASPFTVPPSLLDEEATTPATPPVLDGASERLAAPVDWEAFDSGTAQPAEAVTGQAPASHRTPAFAPPSGSAAERLKAAELAELSPVELIERLAISLQRRRAAAPASPQADFVGAPQAEPQQVAPSFIARIGAEEPEAPVAPAAIPAPAATVGLEAAPRALPAGLRPLSFEDEDEDIAEAPSFALPPRQITMADAPAPAASDDEEAGPEETDEIDLDDGYSSLLELGRQSASRASGAKQSFIRIEEPDHTAGDEFEPVVVFPSQASRLQVADPAPVSSSFADPSAAPAGDPAAGPESAPAAAQPVRRFDNPALQSPAGSAGRKDPEEAERALRSALATLQRMSGAA